MNPKHPFIAYIQSDIILLCVRWYLRYPLSYRNLEEMMLERGGKTQVVNGQPYNDLVSGWRSRYSLTAVRFLLVRCYGGITAYLSCQDVR